MRVTINWKLDKLGSKIFNSEGAVICNSKFNFSQLNTKNAYVKLQCVKIYTQNKKTMKQKEHSFKTSVKARHWTGVQFSIKDQQYTEKK